MTAYDPNNVFAKILRGEMPAHKVYEDDKTFAFMDIMPRTDGHALVISKSPGRTIVDLSPEDVGAVFVTVQKLARVVPKIVGADGVQIEQFNEPASGQVVFHMHVHILPRFEGVKLRPHLGDKAPNDVIVAQAEKIRAALAAG